MKTKIEFKIKGSPEIHTFQTITQLRKLVYSKTHIHHSGLIKRIEIIFGEIEYLKLGNVKII